MSRDSLKVLGASNHSDAERNKLDYYGTDRKSTESLLQVETFSSNIWEPCAGHHLIANKLIEHGYNVKCSDIAEYEEFDHEILDFFDCTEKCNMDIITNPPYNLATDFAAKALDLLMPGRKLALFLRLQYLEGVSRYEKVFKKNPPKTIYIFVNRQVCSKKDDFSEGSAVAYAWFVWEKGFTGDPVVKWLRN